MSAKTNPRRLALARPTHRTQTLADWLARRHTPRPPVKPKGGR